MKARPILFSMPMVQALMDGRKTQTRRVVKSDCQEIVERDDGSMWPWREDCERGGDIWYPCPYGKPGDLLYVRETWCPIYPQEQHYNGGRPIAIDYAASNGYGSSQWRLMDVTGSRRWKPSIHMPRWASRLTLEITDVRVERVRDITSEDAECEGLWKRQHKGHFAFGFDGGAPHGYGSATGAFHALWDSINAARGFGWDANPWVWVVQFNVHHCNVDGLI